MAGFLSLGDEAARAVCVCATQAVLTDELCSLGFVEVNLSSQFTLQHWRARSWPSSADCVLVLSDICDGQSFGHEYEELQHLCKAIGENETVPTFFMVFFGCEDRVPLHVNEVLLEFVDDVVCIPQGQRFTSRQIKAAILRTEKLAQRSYALINQRVGEVEDKARRAVNLANRNFLWSMPGKALESIPKVNASLPEWDRGVGSYSFDAVLGKGAFGQVFLARNGPTQDSSGPVAVKLIQKTSVKSSHSLMSLDREFCIMCHLQPHPNVVHAYDVLHTERNLYLVMDYAGTLNLHEYCVQHAKDGKGLRLPSDVIKSFCMQYAGGLAHLHGAKVIHRDLKPNNIIVSDNRSILKLTDFGLAVLIVGPKQKLGDSCGSLPFCAPEVLGCAMGDGPYDGFHADVWSLAVNFVDIALGPYSVEKILKWVPKSPSTLQAKILGLRQLPSRVTATQLTDCPDGARRAIQSMLVEDPDARCSMVRVLELLGCDKLHVRPPERDAVPLASRGPRALRTMTYAAGKGVKDRAIGASVLAQIQSIDTSAPLAERLGGTAVIRVGIDGLFDRILSDGLLRPLFDCHLPRVQSICSHMKRGLTIYMYPQLDKKFIDDQRMKLRRVHHCLNITDTHFDAFLRHFQAAFLDVGVDSNTVEEAVGRVKGARFDITAGDCLRSACSRERNTSAWRTAILARVELSFSAFTLKLQDLCSKDEAFSGSVAAHQEIAAQLWSYLNDDSARVIPASLMSKDDDAHFEKLLSHIRSAMEGADWGVDITETLCFAARREHRQLRLQYHLSHCPGITDELAWQRISSSQIEELAKHPRTRFFGEHPGLRKCLEFLGRCITSGVVEHPGELAAMHQNLGLDHDHFDVFLSTLLSVWTQHASASTMQLSYISDALCSFRPWILRYGMERQARAFAEQSWGTAFRRQEADKDLHLGCIAGSVASNQSEMSGLYDRILQDDRINSFFGGAKMEQLRVAQDSLMQRIAKSVCSAPGANYLSLKHDKWKITDYHFDCFMDCVRKSLVTQGESHSQVDVDAQLGRLEVLRPKIVHGGEQTVSRPPAVGSISSACFDIDVIVDGALRLAATDERFKSFCVNGALAPPCKTLGLLHILRSGMRGESLPNLAHLRDIHAHVLLSTSQFQALVSAFERVLQDFEGFDSSASQLLQTLKSLEEPLTGTSDKDQSMEIDEDLLQRLGGTEALERLVERWLELLGEEANMQCFFGAGVGINDAARARKKQYLIDMVSSNHTSVNVARIHCHLAIKAEHFDAFLRCLRKAASETWQSVPQRFTDRYVKLIEQHGSTVLSSK